MCRDGADDDSKQCAVMAQTTEADDECAVMAQTAESDDERAATAQTTNNMAQAAGGRLSAWERSCISLTCCTDGHCQDQPNCGSCTCLANSKAATKPAVGR